MVSKLIPNFLNLEDFLNLADFLNPVRAIFAEKRNLIPDFLNPESAILAATAASDSGFLESGDSNQGGTPEMSLTVTIPGSDGGDSCWR